MPHRKPGPRLRVSRSEPLYDDPFNLNLAEMMKSNIPARRARLARALRGRGLEIGALHLPLKVPDAVEVVYADILTPEDIDRLFPGSRYPDIVSDCTNFTTVADNTFDFVVANHVLEHVTDPIGAVTEWHRILKDGGILFLGLPDKRYTFDHARRRTPLKHVIDDYCSNIDPKLKDLEHVIDCARNVERLRPGTAEWKVYIEESHAAGVAVHKHVWVLLDVMRLFLHLYRSEIVQFSLSRYANTSAFGNEFVLLLRVRKSPSATTRVRDVAKWSAGLAAAAAEEPLQVAKSRLKRVLKGDPRAVCTGKPLL